MQNQAMLNTLAALESVEAKLQAAPDVEIVAAKDKPVVVFDKADARRAAVVMRRHDLGCEEGKLYEAKEVSLKQLQDPNRKFDLAMWADDIAQARKLAKDLEDRRAWGQGSIVVPPALAPEHDAKVEQQVKTGESKEKFPKAKGAGDMGKKVKVNQEDPGADAMTKLKAAKVFALYQGITYEEAPEALTLKCSTDCQEELKLAVASADYDPQRELADVFESIISNSDLDWIRPEEVGALTDAPIIGHANRDDKGDLATAGQVYWYPQYETKDPVAELAETGTLVFTGAPENVKEQVTAAMQIRAFARKVTDRIAEAFREGKRAKVGNTSTDGTSVFLHGNEIVRRAKDGSIEVTLAGWPTTTTRERINGILSFLGIDVRVYQKGGNQYLGDKRWDGEWATVGDGETETAGEGGHTEESYAAEMGRDKAKMKEKMEEPVRLPESEDAAPEAGPRFNLVWEGETVEKDLDEKEANYLLNEYNIAYKGGVTKVRASLKATEDSSALEAEDVEVSEFEFRYLGLENEQYFQGFGTSFTKWDLSETGIGDSERDAADDAVENLASSGVHISDDILKAMNDEIEKMSKKNKVYAEVEDFVRAEHPGASEEELEGFMEEALQDSSLHVYVGILVKTKSKAGTGEGPAHEALETTAQEAAEHKV